MKVIVKWPLCEGNGSCVVAAPEIFDITDKDELVVLDETPSNDKRQKLLDAIASCPRHALSFEE